MNTAIHVYAGKDAFEHIKAHGLSPEDISMVLGASSGPKWLVLHGIDQFLFKHFFSSRHGESPLHLLGTSAGAWRMACYAQNDSIAAHDRLTSAYVEQKNIEKPTPDQIRERCEELVATLLGSNGSEEILNHPYARMHLITTQCHGLTLSERRWIQGLGYGIAGLMNGISRKSLGTQFTRVVMHHPNEKPPMKETKDIPTRLSSFTPSNIEKAIVSTGTIPLLIKGVEDVAGKGIYQDGGITDYGFDLPLFPDKGFVLYPHFSKRPAPGWFDKQIKWRTPSLENYAKTIMLVPSDEFVSHLPYAKIPDRKDFFRFPESERIQYWYDTIAQSRRLYEALVNMDWRNQVEPLPWS